MHASRAMMMHAAPAGCLPKRYGIARAGRLLASAWVVRCTCLYQGSGATPRVACHLAACCGLSAWHAPECRAVCTRNGRGAGAELVAVQRAGGRQPERMHGDELMMS